MFTDAEGTAPSGAATLTVDVTVAPGDDATFSITVDGDPVPTVQWQVMTDDSTGVQAVVTNTPPTVTTAPLAVTAAAGADATFSLTVTGNPTPTIQWKTSVDGYAYTDVVGANGTSLTLQAVTAAQDGLFVRAYLSSDAGALGALAVALLVSGAGAVVVARRGSTAG